MRPTYCRVYGPSSCNGFIRTKWLVATGHTPHTPQAPPTEYSKGHHQMLSPNAQNTCRLVGEKKKKLK